MLDDIYFCSVFYELRDHLRTGGGGGPRRGGGGGGGMCLCGT